MQGCDRFVGQAARPDVAASARRGRLAAPSANGHIDIARIGNYGFEESRCSSCGKVAVTVGWLGGVRREAGLASWNCSEAGASCK